LRSTAETSPGGLAGPSVLVSPLRINWDQHQGGVYGPLFYVNEHPVTKRSD